MHWKHFRSDKYYLLKYLGTQTFIMVLLCLIFNRYNLSAFDLNLIYVIPLAVFIGIKLPSIMHNAVHGNLPVANSFLGELTSQIILVSFGVVCVNHTFHHAYPDSEKDPHSPQNKTFLLFFLTCLHSGVNVIKKAYLNYHGKTVVNQRLFLLTTLIHFISLPLKFFVWYKLLGFNLFIKFYLVAFLSFSFTFAHVNYATHEHSDNGNVQTLNLNENLWHKFVNLIADGIYFHHNHHKNPNLYNPQKITEHKCNFIGEALRRISIFS